ncbi:hypothetical protein F9L16_19975 [Agarivorans sp. B2Z047]|uniref:hypothetical protein n=1 Tax=Agarivorans sp. B2Z047 TaxID=2652721 RepID=UPI00128D2E4D|nr:hypothetical protein [Agarivorans sp. B2Z047]MPW31255.1 hypothetical protein [Agarivorans sp. B2Z047]UQN42779.1 hypothetical protein LQZ07_23890 [Agarivorans sp. B2Z047]
MDTSKEREEKITNVLVERYKKCGSLPGGDYVFDAVLDSFCDKAIWKKYLSGEVIPTYSEEGKLSTSAEREQIHPYTVNLIEALFPEIEGVFKNGPYGLMSVLQSNSAVDALEQFELNLAQFARETGYSKKTFIVPNAGDSIDSVEFVELELTWNDIRSEINREPYRIFDILCRFLPDIELDQKWTKDNEASLFLHIIAGYVEARFLKVIPHVYSNVPGVDAARLASIAIHDYEKGAEAGILYFERRYGIDRKLWFDRTLFGSNINVFDLARKNTLKVAGEVFPELQAFAL